MAPINNNNGNNKNQRTGSDAAVSCELPLGDNDDEKKNNNKKDDNTSSSTKTTNPFQLCWYICGILIFPLRVVLGGFAFCCGFCCNTCFDIFGKTSKQETWDETKDALSDFLKESGIMDEVQLGWNQRFIQNARLVNAIERHIYPNGSRIEATRIDNENENYIEENSSITTTCDVKKACRIMKHATAAYGPQVIANAVFESGERLPPLPTDKSQYAIMKHIGIPNKPENIVVMKLKYGEKLNYLRHFCVIDNKNKCIVLAVRGTYSVSSTYVDLAGYCEEFCGAYAHSGMAKMAIGIWESSGSAIVQALEDHPDYEFIICGHSLGAGVAGLLNVMLNDQIDFLPPATQNNIQCYLYGGPPSFSTLSDVDNKLLPAVKNTKCFIYNKDTVPYISVDSARRFMKILAAIDELKTPFWKAFLIDHEFMEPTQEMIDTFNKVHNNEELLPKINRAPALYNPAAEIIWIEQEPRKGVCKLFQRETYRLTYCDPKKVVKLGPMIHPNGIGDHLTGRYEYSLTYTSHQH